MTVHFVNRFYWPDEPATAQLLGDLAEGLAGRGYRVSVIASRPRGTNRSERVRGVGIVRVGGGRARDRALPGKAFNFAAYALGAWLTLSRTVRAGDVVVCLTDPPLLGVAAASVAARRGARVVHWIQDIYPEVALACGAPPVLRALRPIRDRSWRRATACVTLGADMASVVAAAGVDPARIKVIPNWPPAGLGPASPEAVAARRRAWGIEGRFIAQYSGNLGRVHDLTAVLAAAAELRDDPSIGFLFVGGGPRLAELEREASRRGLGNIAFRPAQPRSELAATLGAGDVHLVALRAGCEACVFPSKLAGAAAAGRPVAFVGPVGCEPARQIEAGGFGRAFGPTDGPGLAAALRDWSRAPEKVASMGSAALRFAEGTPFLPAWEAVLGPPGQASDK